MEIAKNSHFINKLFPYALGLTFKGYLIGSFKFNGDVSYNLGDEDQKDTNKLVGLSDDIFSHHNDSVRIGWRWDLEKSKVQMMAIFYVEGKRTIKPLTHIDPNRTYNYQIKIEKGYYEVEVNNRKARLKRESGYNFLRVILPPYFGGQKKAPKTFNFDLSY